MLAPYRGCGHGCVYCDGRAERYFVEGNFERDIAVRSNLIQKLRETALKGFTEFGALGLGSGVTDVYQDLDKDRELTRKTLESLQGSNLPIVVLTKNALIQRDFDLLSRFPKALVCVTLTTVNPAKASVLEPHASPPEERLETVRRAKKAGFYSGVMAMPLCPGITDTNEETGALVAACESAGADFIYPGGLTLRPGCQKDGFMDMVREYFPELVGTYERLYGENRASGMHVSAYRTTIPRTALPSLIPHSVHRNLLSLPDSIFVLLCHMDQLYRKKGVNTAALSKATGAYAHWLKEERTALRRKRLSSTELDPFPITRILSERLAVLDLKKTIGNDKLARLLDSIIREGAVFNYSSLSLE